MLVGFAIAIAGIYFAKVVLIPIALALLVTFLLAPVVARLQRWRLNRIVSIGVAVMLIGLATGAVGWLVAGQVTDLVAKMPGYRHSIQQKVATIRSVFGERFERASKTVQDLGSDLGATSQPGPASEPVQTVRIAEPQRGPFDGIRDAAAPTIDAVLTAAIAFLLAFVILLSKEDLRDRVIRLVGHGKVLATTHALDEAASKVSSYLIRLLLLNGLHGTAVALGLALIGVPNALVWGLLSALLRFIPYAGPWIAASLPILTSMAVFDGWVQPLMTIGLFVALELVSNNIVEPWLYGRGTGVSPLAILVSTLFWTWIWGPVGLVLATPITVCVVVMSKHVPDLNFLYLLFGDTPALPPPARLYQRLVAGDQDQAWSVLHAEMKERELHAVYDAVVLPALSMAERDRQQGALDIDGESQIVESMKLLLEEANEEAVAVAPSEAATPRIAPVERAALRVLCVPSRNATDGLAATMLRQVLERDGAQVDVAALDGTPAAALSSLESRPVDVVCISSVPPSRFIYLRYLCKQIAARHPRLPIIVGMWTLDPGASEAADPASLPAGVHKVRLLAEARSLVRELAEPAR
jgi:predicted PurR-regulated permease PerM